jgi:trimeric autotransporter adhesin
MKKLLLFTALLFSFCITFSQAANNTCATAQSLGTLTGNYTATRGDLYLADATTAPTGTSCAGTRYDVWYTFTLPAGSTGVTINVVLDLPGAITNGLSNTNTFIELFNTSNCTLNGNSTGGCNNVSQPRRYTGLTAGGTYTFRVNTTQNPTLVAQSYFRFNLFVVPNNDDCSNLATILQPGSTVDGNLAGSTNSSIATFCTGTNPDDDVWYSFTALYSYATITLSNIGSAFAASGSRMELFSGNCTSLNSISCSGATNVINATGLTPNNTYYVRVYSAGTGTVPATTANWGFRISLTPSAKVVVGSGRMKEVFHQQIISAPEILNNPWEITYGPDNNLWVTEAGDWRVFKINPVTGVRDTLLDIKNGSTFLPLAERAAFNQGANFGSFQGGLAGLALHPRFLDGTGLYNYVYISYGFRFDSNSVANVNCKFYKNQLVRFTFNTGSNRLESPVSLCDTLPGSNDHNSQRIIIAPITIGGPKYLFYASGDMGGGQLNCAARLQKAQFTNSYEGKILRFNLEPDADADQGAVDYNQWIPNSNPFNNVSPVTGQSAVWVTGIRNNQGFAYDSTLNILYGSSHGAYSDDELNIIESGRNYGHPLVMGMAADDNYNGASAGTPRNTPASTCPIIVDESTNAANIGPSYKDPLFTAYASSPAYPSIYTNIWNAMPTPPNSGANGGWPSEAWSGMDIYTNTVVPGWKQSLLVSSLKWGRLVRLKLRSTGDSVIAIGGAGLDTASYFGSVNRFRDMAFAPNGKDIYVAMDRSTSTSGPSTLFPVVSACRGCIQKYTFLGYAPTGSSPFPSTIPTSIPIDSASTAPTPPGCVTATQVSIRTADNNTNLWVPITGPNGNIIAEIKANGNDLGDVTTSFYTRNNNALRTGSQSKYMNRNVTINVAGGITPRPYSTPVSVRLYVTDKELKDMINGGVGVAGLNDVGVFKNNDPCGAAIQTVPSGQVVTARTAQSSFGHVIQFNVDNFSSFYFFNVSSTLPFELFTFTGKPVNDASKLEWVVGSQTDVTGYTVERSLDNVNFESITTVQMKNGGEKTTYNYTDFNAAKLGTVIYYRIRSNETTGTGKYSNIISVNFGTTLITSVSLMPNPVTNKTTVIINAVADETAQLKVVDNTGRIIRVMNVSLVKGKNNISLDVSNFKPGLYYIDVNGKAISEKTKLIKH